jgi:hypothetical protein
MLTDPVDDRYVNLALNFVRRMRHVYTETTRVSKAGHHAKKRLVRRKTTHIDELLYQGKSGRNHSLRRNERREDRKDI